MVIRPRRPGAHRFHLLVRCDFVAADTALEREHGLLVLEESCAHERSQGVFYFKMRQIDATQALEASNSFLRDPSRV